MLRGRGFVSSPPDERDFPAEQLLGAAAPIQDSVDLSSLSKIHDQGQTNSCVIFSSAQALRVYLKYRGLLDDVWFSIRFGYYNTLVAQNQGIKDDGCIPRYALQSLQDTGFCAEASWPWDETNVLAHPLPDAYTMAEDQKRKTTYYRITSTGEDLKFAVRLALNKGYPVIWGGPIDAPYEAYYENGGNGLIQTPTAPWVGSHMRCIVGYTPDYMLEANSWGTMMGLNGFGRVDWNFVANAPSLGYEFWVFDSVPNLTG